MQQLDIHGVIIPTFIVLAIGSLIASQIIGRFFSYVGLYRIVWHRPLFNLAFYIMLLGASTYIYNRFLQ